MKSNLRSFLRLSIALLSSGCLLAQQPASQAPRPPQQVPGGAAEGPQPVYLMEPNDVVVIRALNAEELSDKSFKIDQEGFLDLPLVGRIRAGGLTVEQFEATLTDALKKIIKEPQVAVNIIERAKTAQLQPSVTALGGFKSPGIYPLIGRDTVLDVLSRAGGLQPSASHRIKLTRRIDHGPIPLPNASPDQDGKVTTVEIALNGSLELVNPNENIELKPFDLLNIAKLEMVYMTGEINKPGALPLEDRESLSVAQAISLSGGFGKDAQPTKAWILRPVLNTSRRAAIPVDVKAIMAGRQDDVPLLPNDVLVIPRGAGTLGYVRTVLTIAIPAVITTLIYYGLR